MDQHHLLTIEMIRYESGQPARIQHFMKVHAFARFIGISERIDKNTMEILEIASLVHDIGIKPSLEKHGSSNGKFQEQEGPPAAYAILSYLHYPEELVQRVCYLVGHHHTYDNIDGLDYQILVEADFLVNILEEGFSNRQIEEVKSHIFKTNAGTKLLNEMYLSK